jgi:exonuclease VII small subunit
MSQKSITLEEKLLRLQEIQKLIETKQVNLTESFTLIQEAYSLKSEIDLELNKMENELIRLSAQSNEEE